MTTDADVRELESRVLDLEAELHAARTYAADLRDARDRALGEIDELNGLVSELEAELAWHQEGRGA